MHDFPANPNFPSKPKEILASFSFSGVPVSEKALAPGSGVQVGAGPHHVIEGAMHDVEGAMPVVEGAMPVLHGAVKSQEQFRHEEERSADYYKGLGTIAGLGASVSFALIVSNLADPKEVSAHPSFDLSTARIFLATGWAIHMLVIYLSFALSVSAFWYSEAYQRRISKIVFGITLVGWMFLSLVVAAYVEVAGFFAVGLTGFVLVGVILPSLI
ncbi:hypothetical protein BCR34DRAFT_613362 [Clohesyomyces aquaticus]|uniref:Uncharacterized protein n=1 Tax=Clohesyomyces aquaticus TaxID=1231657 RepID=A0A1Y1ZU04_9PLEO|nr:hypothetical protein BCR34DRAFT_613362 [Clohesyomyces aquaticus]